MLIPGTEPMQAVPSRCEPLGAYRSCRNDARQVAPKEHSFTFDPIDMRLWRTGLFAVVCTLSGTAINAQAPGSMEVGGYGQITRVAPEQARFETREPLSIGIRGRVNLHRGLGVEIEASTGVVDGVGEPLRRRYNQLVARGTYTIPLSDYSGLMLGAGIARSDYEVTYNFGTDVLVGVRTAISGRYVLRSDAIFNYLPTSGATEFGLRTGMQVIIGPVDGPTSRDRKRGNLTSQEPGSIEGGLFAQQWRLNPVWNLRSGAALGTRVGAFVTSRSEFEVEATYGRQAVWTGGGLSSTGYPLRSGDTFRVTTFAFRYVHNFPVGSRAALLAGVGPSRSSYEYIDHWGGSAIAGARLAITRDIHLRGDVVAHYVDTERVVDVGARIGLSTVFRFGR
jgi:hypothetical protein